MGISIPIFQFLEIEESVKSTGLNKIVYFYFPPYNETEKKGKFYRKLETAECFK